MGTPKRPQDLETDHRVVNYVSARTGRVLPMRFQDKQTAVELDMRHVVGVNESNAHFAAGLAGRGVIQTFSFLAQPAVDRGELVPVLTRFQPKPYPLHLACPPNRHVSNRLRVFINWAVQAFGKSMTRVVRPQVFLGAAKTYAPTEQAHKTTPANRATLTGRISRCVRRRSKNA